MKKIALNPLALDMETIAKLDEKQLLEITGGTSSDSDTGSSTGCGSGSSQCLVDEA
ncbi:class I lanthipeptide [Chitinophaga sp.]|uniref:class I lanthipeptide n=1 Tax=Chitinophaga sp. TaxID=1869181 RepID=UPI0031D0717C